ncbi:hypothetical protein NUM3379_22080 [Kineococcus sp. NUM-3379]
MNEQSAGLSALGLDSVTSPDQALQRPAESTDVSGLVLDDNWAGAGFCFHPGSRDTVP